MKDIAIESIENENWFYKEFGVDAEILIDHAWGYEPCTIQNIKHYKPSLKSLSYGQVLPKAYSKKEGTVIIKEMIEQMILDLHKQNLKTISLSFYIGYEIVSNYKGESIKDSYGRTLPKGVSKSITLSTYTSSKKIILNTIFSLYEKLVDPSLSIRRISLSANLLKPKEDAVEQLSLFDSIDEKNKEEKLNQTLIEIQNRYGKNSVIKGTDLEQGATTLERNRQIGGHKA